MNNMLVRHKTAQKFCKKNSKRSMFRLEYMWLKSFSENMNFEKNKNLVRD